MMHTRKLGSPRSLRGPAGVGENAHWCAQSQVRLSPRARNHVRGTERNLEPHLLPTEGTVCSQVLELTQLGTAPLASASGSVRRATALGTRANAFPYFQTMHRDIPRGLKAEADLALIDLQHSDFQQRLAATALADHHHFLAFPCQNQHAKNLHFRVCSGRLRPVSLRLPLRVEARIDPEYERAAKDSHNPAVPGVARE